MCSSGRARLLGGIVAKIGEDLSTSRVLNARGISVIAFAALLGGVAYLLLRHDLIAVGIIPLAVQVAAMILMVWARLTFGMRSFHFSADPTAGKLITSGPYRFLRHPIYAAILFFTIAAVASHPTWRNGIAECVIVAGIIGRVLCEESLLRGEYPDYELYAAQTKRLVPFLY